jgi:hypothetical protein
MVSNGKAIAGQIWILQHARQCIDPACQVQYCRKAKGIFSIARLAKQGIVALSPCQGKAVSRARALLGHFHCCRAARLKRLESDPESPYMCLVCTLVLAARSSPSSANEGISVLTFNFCGDVSGSSDLCIFLMTMILLIHSYFRIFIFLCGSLYHRTCSPYLIQRRTAATLVVAAALSAFTGPLVHHIFLPFLRQVHPPNASIYICNEEVIYI